MIPTYSKAEVIIGGGGIPWNCEQGVLHLVLEKFIIVYYMYHLEYARISCYCLLIFFFFFYDDI